MTNYADHWDTLQDYMYTISGITHVYFVPKSVLLSSDKLLINSYVPCWLASCSTKCGWHWKQLRKPAGVIPSLSSSNLTRFTDFSPFPPFFVEKYWSSCETICVASEPGRWSDFSRISWKIKSYSKTHGLIVSLIWWNWEIH